METAEPKTLAQMIAEVVEVNRANGWYDTDVLLPEALALVHSEISEALEAWRKKGLEPWKLRVLKPATTCLVCRAQTDMRAPECPDHPDKPEGVPSEFADIFIRLLDYAWRFDEQDLEAAVRQCGKFGIYDSFPANMNTLHDLVSLCSHAWEGVFSGTLADHMGGVLVFLRQLSEHYGIDLAAEYEIKLAYNKTRGYRHGGKPI